VTHPSPIMSRSALSPYAIPLALALGLHVPWLVLAGFFDWLAAVACSVLSF